MEGPRLTEERLRNHLNSNQPMRERMCLALLPLLGPFTGERPRRPNGGPDGGRDIEAIYQGKTVTWGAVGFKNGGGSDDGSRADIVRKFKFDLSGALKENPTLSVFVFFTNVDLTPGIIEDLKLHAQSLNISFVDIFDIERIRHVLDSPEGLIARLQYLDIPMSPTEQMALVGKFGSQLQNAVTARFDRVERTLAKMERFLDFQKPIFRLDAYLELLTSTTSASLGVEAFCIKIVGLQDLGKSVFWLFTNISGHKASAEKIVTGSTVWLDEKPDKPIQMKPSISYYQKVVVAHSETSLTTGGHRVRISDLTFTRTEVYATHGLAELAKCIAIDLNGYQLAFGNLQTERQEISIPWPPSLVEQNAGKRWVRLISEQQRDLLFDPLKPSGRFMPLKRT